MKFPEWLKPGLFGAVIGGVAVAIGGFSWGGWMTASGADTMASEIAREEVAAALVPVCLEQARQDPDRAAKMASIKQAASYNRRDSVMEAGWATHPGADSPNRDLAEACLEELDPDAT